MHNIKDTDVNNSEDSTDSMNQRPCSRLDKLKTDECEKDATPELSSDVDSLSCQDEGSPCKILADSDSKDCAQRDPSFPVKNSSEESVVKSDTGRMIASPSDLCNSDSCGVAFSDNSSCAVDTVFFKENTYTISKSESTSTASANSSHKISFSTECSDNVHFESMDNEKICKVNGLNSLNVKRFDSDSDLPDFSFLKKTGESYLDREQEQSNTDLTSLDQCKLPETGTISPKFERMARPQKRPYNSLDVSDDEKLSKVERTEKKLRLKRQRVKKTLPEFPADYSEEKKSHDSTTDNLLSKDIPVNEWDGLPILALSRNSKKDKTENQSTKVDLDDKEIVKEKNQIQQVHIDMEKRETFVKPKKRVYSFKKSAKKTKRQSILSFLTLSEQEACYKDQMEVNSDDTDSLDCVVIDGLDDLEEPEFRDEETSGIESEISCLR